MLGYIAALWGVVGVSSFLGAAIYRLASMSSELNISDISFFQWVVLLLWVVFMAYYEGYKGFQKSFSPRVAARIYYLTSNVTTIRLILAPVFCMGFFDAQRSKVIFVWLLTLGIFVLVQMMTYVPMPWRGIIDLGVVVGLTWGLLSILVHSYNAFMNGPSNYDPGMP